MKRVKKTPTPLSVRTKLLVMLAVLSLPVLIISLTQLNSYRRSLIEQARTSALRETAAAAATLASWLKELSSEAAQSNVVASTAANQLYQYIREHEWPTPGTLTVVFDQQGRPVQDPSASAPLPIPLTFPSEVSPQKWSDGSVRLTGTKRVGQYGWSVAVGVPLPEDTPAGRSALMLTVTWALTLLGSILLGVWAVGRFTKPLRQLASSVSTFGEGKLHERVAVQTSDEVGTMATSFNAMAASLQSKFNEVQTQGDFIEEVLDGLPLGVVVLDAQLIVRKANQTFTGFVGRDAASLTGRGLYEAAAGLAVLSDVVEDVRRTRRPFITYGLPLEMIARGDNAEADASKFWDITIWPTTARSAARGDLLLILSEVSKRVRAEKLATAAFAAEKSRNAELESVINQMNEGVVIVDRQNRYRINPMAAKIMGREPCEFRDGVHALIVDMHLRDAEGRELKPGETPLGRALERGERVSGEQLKMLRGDGEERFVAVSAAPLLGDENRREGMVAVFRDITEDVQQHNELVTAYDRLREHDRLKSAFIIGITHELRTPLNVIIGLCQTLGLDREYTLAPLQSESVMRMERNARALLLLVNDLLDYSRLEAGRSALQLESVEVKQVVKQIAERYAAEARNKGLELRLEVAPELGYVVTDRQKFSKVISNLVNNAIKFTSAGQVSIVAAPLDDQRWYVEVSDTGIGIPSEALTYIFDEFRQVDDRLARAYNGVGLGLALTRKIVELLAGDITVESKPSSGSRFRIVWPHKTQLRTGTGSLVGNSPLIATLPTDLRVRTG